MCGPRIAGKCRRHNNLWQLDQIDTGLLVTFFVASAFCILLAGTKLAHAADVVAARTGWGEALVGSVLLGAATSLPGILTSVTAASIGAPDLAISNAIGGIAAQTAFLAVADVLHRRANLEHAAASIPNLIHAEVLGGLLALVILAAHGPRWSFGGVDPFSLLIVACYLGGLRLARASGGAPMWRPEKTAVTEIAEERKPVVDRRSNRRLALTFLASALVCGAAGFLVARCGLELAARTGISETAVGALLTGTITSLPELVTTIAAVRQGALALAVGGILGGNAFDVLFLAMADVAYRSGSIYEHVSSRHLYLIAMTLAMVILVRLGLLHRERHGLGNVGFEGVLVLVLYLGGMVLLHFIPV